MKMKVVSMMEVCGSPTLCISPLRFFGECHRCDVFISRVAGERRRVRQQGGNLPVEKAIDRAISGLKCGPNVKGEIVALFKRKEELLAELHKINKKLEEAGRLV